MAFTASAVMEMRASGGSNLNSGVFDAGVAVPGTDYTLQDSSQANGTDLVSANGTNATPSVTSVGYTFTTADEGNSIVVSAGTNWTVSVYIITDTSGGAAILDKACGSVDVLAAGTWRMGGAYPGGNATAGISDDARFELLVGGNTAWVKAGTYAMGTVSITSSSGTATNRIKAFGYNSTRGDNPTGSNRPIWGAGANAVTSGNSAYEYRHIQFTGTGTNLLSVGASSYAENVKAVNSSISPGRIAITINTSSELFRSESVSQNGIAISASSTSISIIGNDAHDSDTGISITNNNSMNISFNLLTNNKTAGISATAISPRVTINSNTIYGSQAKIGIGISMSGVTSSNTRIYNNTFSGLAEGINIGTVLQDSVVENYNNFHNNTTDRTNINTGANSIALDPTFTSVTQITGTGATSDAAVITMTGADLSTVAVNDFIRVVSATTAAAMTYRITAFDDGADTVTVDPTIGTGSNIVWSIGTNRNFSVGTNMKAVGFPGAFSSNSVETTGYLDIGAVQRVEPASGGGLLRPVSMGGGLI